jgi:tetratricopeptide (TPR) repeat protein
MIYTLYRIVSVAAVVLSLWPFHGSLAGTEKPEDPKAFFERAAQYYKAGQYDDAIAEYNRLLSQGLESGPLYYNLANGYLKCGELGRALLNYERAKRIMPSDGDLLSNYAYAQSFVQAGPEEVKPFQEALVDRLFGRLSLDALTLLSSSLYGLILMLFIIRGHRKTAKKSLSMAIGLAAVLLLFFSFGVYQQYSSRSQTAIVLSKKTEAKFQPFDRAGVHFSLPEGMKVRVLSSQGEWIKIRASDRKTGWVKAIQVERI